MAQSALAIQLIEEWIEKFIIGEGICPFAKTSFEQGQIAIYPCEEKEKVSEEFLNYIERFHKSPSVKVSNGILAFINLEIEFLDFFHFVEECKEILESISLGDSYELVCFHPNFHFEGESAKDRGSLVNQSPYPIIHILRKEELYAAANSEQGLSVAKRNKQFLEGLSEERFLQLQKIVKKN